MLNKKILRKVPEITLLFWVVKLLSTALGESTSDYFVVRVNPYIAVFIGAIVFTISLLIQLHSKKYTPWIYWFTVAMVAVFGTMAADALHKQIGLPYLVSTVIFSVALATIFTLWYKSERTLSIHQINTQKREYFYWATVFATFALGTAVGDLTAITFHLGYLTSGLLFIALIVIPAIAYYFFGLGEIAAFWIAYIITRPLGASFADWFGKSKAVGGLGWGDGPVSIVLALLIIIFVIFMTMDKKEFNKELGINK